MRDILNESNKILVYGAMLNARNAVNLIDYLCPEKLIGLAVSDMTGNANEIFGYKVRAIDEYEGKLDKKSTLVVISVRASLIGVIKGSLIDRGYSLCVALSDDGGEFLKYLPKSFIEKFESYAQIKNYLMTKRIKDTFKNFMANSGRNEK